MNENLIVELQEKKKELLEKRGEQSGGSDKAAEKEAGKDLDKRIRATKLVYKEIKSFLGQFLVDVAPCSQEVSRLAHLLQDLYSSFTDKAISKFKTPC